MGRQKCYELWGATEDGVEEGYGLSHSQCRDANYMGLVHNGNRDAAACSNDALKGSFPGTRN